MDAIKATQLFGILDLTYSRKAEEVLAIGADFHKGQFKETNGVILAVDEAILKHREVRAWTIVDGRCKSQGS